MYKYILFFNKRFSPESLGNANSVSCAIICPNCVTNTLCSNAGLSISKNKVVRTCLEFGNSRPDTAFLCCDLPSIVLIHRQHQYFFYYLNKHFIFFKYYTTIIFIILLNK